MILRLTLAVLALAGCGGPPRPPPSADADGLRSRLGAAPVIVASLPMRVVPRDGEGELITMRLWIDADGTVRLRGQKLDVDFLEAVIAPDGAYRAWLPRERVATVGRLDGEADPLLLRDLLLLAAELREGPLPAGATPDGLWRWRAGGIDAMLTLAADGLPATKRMRYADGRTVDLAYFRWQAFDGLMRPTQAELVSEPDGTRIILRLRTFDAPPALSPGRMELRVPEDVEQVDAEGFTRRLAPRP